MTSPSPILAGRCAIITGASRGLGKTIAEHFVRAGASVLLTARDELRLGAVASQLASLALQPGQAVHVFRCDVSSAPQCQAAVQEACRRMPRVDVLVNNAGIYGPMGLSDAVDWEQWVDAVEINLFGSVLMCRGVVPLMKAAKYGKIVNLSGGGATAPLPRLSAYAVSKAAVVRFTETLAQELGEHHIDVNAIAPGALNTGMLDEAIAAGPEKVGRAFYDRAVQQRDGGGTPLDRGAELAVFLASAASDGITGRLISAIWDDWRNLPKRAGELAASDIYTLRRIVPKDRGLPW